MTKRKAQPMLEKLTGFIMGREPVAGATGLAGLIIAGFGLLDVFEVLSLTAPQVAAVGVFVTALAGWLARKAVTPVAVQPGGEAGSVPLALIVLVVLAVVLMAGLAVCTDALFEDEDEKDDLGYRLELVSHDYDEGDQDYDQRYGSEDDRNRNRDRNRGAFSPGPFDDSPVTITICAVPDSCPQRGEEPPPEEGEPA